MTSTATTQPASCNSGWTASVMMARAGKPAEPLGLRQQRRKIGLLDAVNGSPATRAAR